MQLGNVISASHKFDCGVPQGSVLGPVLFSLNLAELSDIIREFHHSADHTQVLPFITFDNLQNDFSIMERCIRDLHSWFTSNYLKLNCDRTEFYCISFKIFCR